MKLGLGAGLIARATIPDKLLSGVLSKRKTTQFDYKQTHTRCTFADTNPFTDTDTDTEYLNY